MSENFLAPRMLSLLVQHVLLFALAALFSFWAWRGRIDSILQVALSMGLVVSLAIVARCVWIALNPCDSLDTTVVVMFLALHVCVWILCASVFGVMRVLRGREVRPNDGG